MWVAVRNTFFTSSPGTRWPRFSRTKLSTSSGIAHKSQDTMTAASSDVSASRDSRAIAFTVSGVSTVPLIRRWNCPHSATGPAGVISALAAPTNSSRAAACAVTENKADSRLTAKQSRDLIIGISETG